MGKFTKGDYIEHYKGGEYRFLADVLPAYERIGDILPERVVNAKHTETGDIVTIGVYVNGFISNTSDSLVVYQDADGSFWARPSDMFYGFVELNENERVQRFKKA